MRELENSYSAGRPPFPRPISTKPGGRGAHRPTSRVPRDEACRSVNTGLTRAIPRVGRAPCSPRDSRFPSGVPFPLDRSRRNPADGWPAGPRPTSRETGHVGRGTPEPFAIPFPRNGSPESRPGRPINVFRPEHPFPSADLDETRRRRGRSTHVPCPERWAVSAGKHQSNPRYRFPKRTVQLLEIRNGLSN